MSDALTSACIHEKNNAKVRLYFISRCFLQVVINVKKKKRKKMDRTVFLSFVLTLLYESFPVRRADEDVCSSSSSSRVHISLSLSYDGFVCMYVRRLATSASEMPETRGETNVYEASLNILYKFISRQARPATPWSVWACSARCPLARRRRPAPRPPWETGRSV